MKLTTFFAFVFIAITSSAKDAGPELSKYGQTFKSSEGQVVVEMATFAKKNKDGLYDVLAKVTGPEAEKAGIDGKVIMYTAENAGTGFDLKFQVGKEWRNRFGSRASGWGDWTNFEVYLDGKTYHLYLDDKASKEVRPLHLRTEYLATQTAADKKTK